MWLGGPAHGRRDRGGGRPARAAAARRGVRRPRSPPQHCGRGRKGGGRKGGVLPTRGRGGRQPSCHCRGGRAQRPPVAPPRGAAAAVHPRTAAAGGRADTPPPLPSPPLPLVAAPPHRRTAAPPHRRTAAPSRPSPPTSQGEPPPRRAPLPPPHSSAAAGRRGRRPRWPPPLLVAPPLGSSCWISAPPPARRRPAARRMAAALLPAAAGGDARARVRPQGLLVAHPRRVGLPLAPAAGKAAPISSPDSFASPNLTCPRVTAGPAALFPVTRARDTPNPAWSERTPGGDRRRFPVIAIEAADLSREGGK